MPDLLNDWRVAAGHARALLRETARRGARMFAIPRHSSLAHGGGRSFERGHRRSHRDAARPAQHRRAAMRKWARPSSAAARTAVPLDLRTANPDEATGALASPRSAPWTISPRGGAARGFRQCRPPDRATVRIDRGAFYGRRLRPTHCRVDHSNARRPDEFISHDRPPVHRERALAAGGREALRSVRLRRKPHGS